ncbi:hypothetical protein V1478_008081 [Vespula squamosa]|uniref:Uncharacterized protein n=1 Tax=Vespula squamosa TaxID=30214 RepID=A0ABD2AXS8_VESSQ
MRNKRETTSTRELLCTAKRSKDVDDKDKQKLIDMILARSLVAFWTAWSKHCLENEKIVHIDRIERSGDKGAVGIEGEEERRGVKRREEKRREEETA